MHHTPNLHSPIALLCRAAVLTCCLLLFIGSPGATARATPTAELTSSTVYLPLVTNSMAACNDSEDNDIPAQAKPLNSLGSSCLGSLEDDPVGEDDYYTVTLNPGQSIAIEVTDMPAGADYDLLLYRGMDLVASSNEQGTTNERISYTNTSSVATTYVIRINSYAKSATSANTYVLKSSGL